MKYKHTTLALMLALKAEEARPESLDQARAFAQVEQPYDTKGSRAAIVKKLKAKHGGSAG